jgi:hypothetical protein
MAAAAIVWATFHSNVSFAQTTGNTIGVGCDHNARVLEGH